MYWLIVALRNRFFDIKILRVSRLNVPVISVGNISAGGTGKTPVVEMLIEKLKKNRRLSVVSRGYMRKTSGTVVASDGDGNIKTAAEAGDEPVQIAGKYPGIIVVVDEDRVRGSRKAIEMGADIVLLDDGYQHRYIHRDVNIIVLTGSEILKGDFLLPAGNRREPLNSVRRSDIIFVSRCPDSADFDKISKKLERFNKPVVGIKTGLKSFRQIIPDRDPISVDISGKKAVAFSGIGNPDSFSELLTGAGVTISGRLVFPDHHWYTREEISKIVNLKNELNADCIVTTEKDAARLKDGNGEFFKNENVVVAEIFQKIYSGEEHLNKILSIYMH